MPQRLPSLNALRAFEAVARHLSFTKAAEELNVTRAAVSHQIKYLEDFLEIPLIERKNRSITLTDPAKASLNKLGEGFNSLADAVHMMRSEAGNVRLTVTTAPSFASKWLIHRLHRFSEKHPDIDLTIKANFNLVDDSDGQQSMAELFRTQDIDVIIRFGSGDYFGYHVEKLFSVAAVPLCSPKLLSDEHPHPLKTLDDLQHHTLLHDDTAYLGRPTWDRWLERAHVSNVNVHRGLHFNQVSLAMDAALDGQGVLLSMEPLARFDIQAGRLCIPFDLSMPLEHGYYIISAEDTEFNRPTIEAFVHWLHDEITYHTED